MLKKLSMTEVWRSAIVSKILIISFLIISQADVLPVSAFLSQLFTERCRIHYTPPKVKWGFTCCENCELVLSRDCGLITHPDHCGLWDDARIFPRDSCSPSSQLWNRYQCASVVRLIVQRIFKKAMKYFEERNIPCVFVQSFFYIQ